MKLGICQLCEREVEVTDHHLIPRTRHKNVKKTTTAEQRNFTVPLCRACHSQIHDLITEKEMERTYNTIEKLKEHEGVQKFINWIKDRTFMK